MKAIFCALLIGVLSVRALAQDAARPRVEPADRTHLAFASASDPNPGSGRGQIVAGWIALGVGLVGMAGAPRCVSEDYEGEIPPRRCRNIGLVFGAVGLSLGVPWLVFGYRKQRAQRAWKLRHGLSALPLTIGVDRNELSLSVHF